MCRPHEVSILVGVFMSRPILPVAKMWSCLFFHTWFISSLRVISRAPRLFFRTQEELRVREEDQQTITVEVELKRHDSEPTISVPQPPPEARYADTRGTLLIPQNVTFSLF